MTVATTTISNTASGNGVTTIFPYTFSNDPNDLTTVKVAFIVSDVRTEQASGFTVVGGNVVFTVAPPTGTTVFIYRDTPETQPATFANQGPFYAANHERAFDRATRQIQELQAGLARTLRVDISEAVTDPLPLTNPASKVVGFDSLGAPALLDVTVTDASVLRADLASDDPGNGASLVSLEDGRTVQEYADDLAGTGGAAEIGFLQTGTGATARTVLDELRDTVRSTQFATLQQAVDAAAGKRLLVVGDYTIVAAVTLPSDIVIDFDAGATITSDTQNISHFQATGKTNITVRGGRFVATNPGASAYVGGVFIDTCDHCIIENNTFIGMQWGGVYLLDSDYNRIAKNTFSAFLGTVFDSADIVIHGNSSYNDIEENDCRGGRVHGILNQGHTAGVFPRRNNIVRNKIGAHTGYGVAVYQIDAGDTFTLVADNVIEGITGTALGGSSGAGVYVVASGGCIIRGNRIKDCCLNSSNETLTPAGIGINGIDSPRQPVIIEGNEVTDIRGYSCINASSSNGSVIVANNVIQVAAGITLTRGGIYINACDNAQVIGNKVRIDATITTTGILVFANGRSIDNVQVTDNQVIGTNLRGYFVTRTAAFRTSNLIVTGNSATGGGNACVPFDFLAGDGLSFSENVGIATSTTESLRLNNVTQVRGVANRMITNGGGTTPAMTTANSCANSFFDASNYFNARITNAGTGLIIEQYGTAAPTVGTQAVGDRTINSVPTVGQPKAWVTTVAGTPGTQVSEGNL